MSATKTTSRDKPHRIAVLLNVRDIPTKHHDLWTMSKQGSHTTKLLAMM
jgi:hypothetical protein